MAGEMKGRGEGEEQCKILVALILFTIFTLGGDYWGLVPDNCRTVVLWYCMYSTVQ